MGQKTKLDDKLDRLDTFVLAGVITVLITRGFLFITGFPQVGNDTLHVAHVLWGGLFLVFGFLLLLLGEQVNKILVALIGGIGFGLFIDEVGKFITNDNDYFYKPAFSIMYVLFLLIWFLSRLIIMRQENQQFLSPAEWPEKRAYGLLIVGWIAVQALAGLIILAVIISEGFDKIEDFIGITGLGVLAAISYAAFLAFGLFRMYQKKLVESAHIIRGATIFAILVMYPFIFFHYPATATIGMLITVPVTIGLSEISLKDLLLNLFVFTHGQRSEVTRDPAAYKTKYRRPSRAAPSKRPKETSSPGRKGSV